MKKLVTLLFLCVLFLVLDNTLVPFFAIRGYYPSLLLIFVIFYSINNGSFEGVWLGAFAGVLQDIFFINAFGVNAFANILVCMAAGFIGVGIFKEKRLIPIVSCFALAVTKGIIVFCILYLLKIHSSFNQIIFNSVYSLVVSVFMYKRVHNLCQKEYIQRKWSFYDR